MMRMGDGEIAQGGDAAEWLAFGLPMLAYLVQSLPAGGSEEVHEHLTKAWIAARRLQAERDAKRSAETPPSAPENDVHYVD